jgi:hypothetical protein
VIRETHSASSGPAALRRPDSGTPSPRAPAGLADGTDDLRRYFRYYQAAEVAGAESFGEEKARLDGAETEADISTISA